MNSKHTALPSRTRRRRVAVSVALAAAITAAISGCGTRLERGEILAGGVAGGSAGTGAQGGDQSVTGGDGTTTAGGAADGAAVGGVDGTSTDAGTSTGTGTDAGTSTGTGTDAGTGTGTGTGTGAGTGTGTQGGAGTKAGPGGTTATGNAPAGAAIDIKNLPIFGGTAACSPATGTPIKMGNVSTLSGVLGQLFSPVVPALQIFVKSQNACGGLNGHPIQLVIGDDQGDPSTARSVANRQIANDKVQAFLGNIQVLTIDSMVGLVQKAGIPMIGGDITNNTWFSKDFIFPQGPPPQSIGYAYNDAAQKVFGKKKVASVYCAEVPQACSQIDKAFVELAPKQGNQMVNSTRISITSPSYQSQCIQLQNAGAEVVALTFDAAAQVRFANDCAKVNFKPKYLSYPLGVGNERQYLGNPSLGGAYVPLNAFGWMANATPAEKYWQKSVAKYNPGFTSGNAASLGWLAGALAVAGSGKLGSTPTSAQLFEGLYTVKDNNLGGMAAPLSFTKGKTPRIPYCLFGVKANKDNSGWETPISKAVCTTTRAPSDPNQ